MIIEHEKADIVALTETHLNSTDELELEGYVVFENRREGKHVNARKTFGGIALLIKDSMLKHYNVRVCNNNVEGLLVVSLIEKISHLRLDFCCVYVPPENSNWCNIEEILDELTIHIYTDNEFENIVLMGDFNARVSNCLDYQEEIDKIEPRLSIDTKLNPHGKSLLEWLICNKLGILNGRLGPSSNMYTCTHTGNSVVDYVITNHENLCNFSDMKIKEINDYLNMFRSELTVTDNVRTSDHAIITCKMSVNYCNLEKESYEIKNCKQVFNYKVFPVTFMNSDAWNRIVLGLIEPLSVSIRNQMDLDNWYCKFVRSIFKEMDENLNFKVIHPDVRKRFKYHKPYWCAELRNAWEDMSKASKSKNNADFKHKQRRFDVMLKREKRNYYKSIQNNIASANVEDPVKFWKYIESLGPKRSKGLPNAVNINGSIENDPDVVINKWKNDFKKLFQKPDSVKYDYNHSFKTTIMREWRRLEQSVVNNNTNEILNAKISVDELRVALSKLKDNKATEVDELKNEIIKHKKFRKCCFKFVSNVL